MSVPDRIRKTLNDYLKGYIVPVLLVASLYYGITTDIAMIRKDIAAHEKIKDQETAQILAKYDMIVAELRRADEDVKTDHKEMQRTISILIAFAERVSEKLSIPLNN